MFKKTILMGLLLLVSSAALADRGAYVQGQLGVISVDVPSVLAFPALDAGLALAPTGRLSGGYLWGDQHFNYGFEVGGQYYQTTQNTSASITIFNITTSAKETDKLKGFNADLLGVVQYTFDSGFNVFAKAGGAYVYQTLHTQIWVDNASAVDTTGSDHVWTPEVALGAGYQFTPHWGVNLSGDYLFKGPQPLDSSIKRIVSVLAGVSYHF